MDILTSTLIAIAGLLVALCVLVVLTLRCLHQIERRPDPAAAEPVVVPPALPGIMRALARILKRLDEPLDVVMLKSWKKP